ncbi:hypothetical protein D9M70_285890 [compost metagenome]
MASVPEAFWTEVVSIGSDRRCWNLQPHDLNRTLAGGTVLGIEATLELTAIEIAISAEFSD